MLKTLTIFKSFIIFVLLLSANVFFLGCDKNKGSTSQETPIDPELLILEEPEGVSASWLVQSDLDAIDGSKNIDKDDLKFKVPKNFTRFFFNSLREDFTEHPGSIIRGSCDIEKEVQESLEVDASETGSLIISGSVYNQDCADDDFTVKYSLRYFRKITCSGYDFTGFDVENFAILPSFESCSEGTIIVNSEFEYLAQNKGNEDSTPGIRYSGKHVIQDGEDGPCAFSVTDSIASFAVPCKETQIDNTNYLNDAALYSSAKIDNGIIKVVLDYNNMLVDISNIIDSVTSGTVAFKVNNWSGEAVYSEESSLTSPFSFTVTNGAENYSGSYCLEFPECASGE